MPPPFLVAAVASTQAVTNTAAPTVIPGDKMGAAAFTDGSNSTLVVYQAADSSIQSLGGYGPPLSASTYTASALLAAGIARNDTPLALTTEYKYYTVVSRFHTLPSGNVMLIAAFFFNRRNICFTLLLANAPTVTTFTSYTTSLSVAGSMVRSIR